MKIKGNTSPIIEPTVNVTCTKAIAIFLSPVPNQAPVILEEEDTISESPTANKTWLAKRIQKLCYEAVCSHDPKIKIKALKSMAILEPILSYMSTVGTSIIMKTIAADWFSKLTTVTGSSN